MKLRDIALARSGDKGNRATLSVIARDPAHYPLLAHVSGKQPSRPFPGQPPQRGRAPGKPHGLTAARRQSEESAPRLIRTRRSMQ